MVRKRRANQHPLQRNGMADVPKKNFILDVSHNVKGKADYFSFASENYFYLPFHLSFFVVFFNSFSDNSSIIRVREISTQWKVSIRFCSRQPTVELTVGV